VVWVKRRGSHLILVLDQELDSLNGSGSGLGDGGRHSSHKEVGHERLGILGLLNNVGHGRYCGLVAGQVGRSAISLSRTPRQLFFSHEKKLRPSRDKGIDSDGFWIPGETEVDSPFSYQPKRIKKEKRVGDEGEKKTEVGLSLFVASTTPSPRRSGIARGNTRGGAPRKL